MAFTITKPEQAGSFNSMGEGFAELMSAAEELFPNRHETVVQMEMMITYHDETGQHIGEVYFWNSACWEFMHQVKLK